MIIFQNSIIKMVYNPATDIVEIDYPDLHDYLLPEIKHNIDILVDMVRNYDVKRVLLDSSATIIDVSPDESSDISFYLAAGLFTTRLQKLARIQCNNPIIERHTQENIQFILSNNVVPFDIENFTSKDAAIKWLIS
jgi:hypothetical protein